MTIDLQGRAFTIPNRADARLHADIKAIPGARWDAKKLIWRAPLACAPFVDELARTHYMQLTAGAHDAIERLHASRDEGVALPDLDAPLASGRRLFAHQKDGVRFLIRRRRAILADDMGLGKTCQALIAAACYRMPIHVICPSSLRDNWTREARDLGMLVFTHSWAKLPPQISGPYVLIADEAHYAQSGKKSQRGAAFLALAEASQATFCLTGTPMKNGRPANLFPLLQAVRSPLAINRGWYDKRYCDAKATRWCAWDASGASNLDELGARVRPVMLRRMKSECLDLPAKTRVMRQADVTTEAQRLYTVTFENRMEEFARRMQLRTDEPEAGALVRFGFRRMASSVAKVATAVTLAEEILEQGGQVVIFVAFLESARMLAAALRGSALLIGETPPEERQALVDRFQAGETRTFITTFGAGGVGITLTRAQTVILVDRPWTPGDCYQAEDRIHRIGQTGSVLSIWLQWDDTDRAVDALLESKSERIEVVMGGRRYTLSPGMSMQKFAELVG